MFAGCSFTWGQGLHYYSNLPNIQEPLPWHYDSNLVSFVNYEFIKSVRFPRIVANHFGSVELTQPFNGGSNASIMAWWNSCFDNIDSYQQNELSINSSTGLPRYKFDEVSHLIFQLTQWDRDFTTIEVDGKVYGPISYANLMYDHREVFLRYLEKNNMTLDEYVDNANQKNMQAVKTFLQKFEDHGVKTYVICWPLESVKYVMEDHWLSKRLITLHFKELEFPSIAHLMGASDQYPVPFPEMSIMRDASSFEVTPSDMHPSLSCHKVIAESVIKRLQ